MEVMDQSKTEPISVNSKSCRSILSIKGLIWTQSFQFCCLKHTFLVWAVPIPCMYFSLTDVSCLCWPQHLDVSIATQAFFFNPQTIAFHVLLVSQSLQTGTSLLQSACPWQFSETTEEEFIIFFIWHLHPSEASCTSMTL